MDLTLRDYEQVKVLSISGDIDGKTAPQVQEMILANLEPGGRMLIDMTGVPFMSSAGLRVLLTTHRRANQENAHIVLVGISQEIQDTMSATGFLGFFKIHDTVEKGLEALQ
jgi:anti-sigma B factor antagonist